MKNYYYLKDYINKKIKVIIKPKSISIFKGCERLLNEAYLDGVWEDEKQIDISLRDFKGGLIIDWEDIESIEILD